jgi:hypothetical protein
MEAASAVGRAVGGRWLDGICGCGGHGCREVRRILLRGGDVANGSDVGLGCNVRRTKCNEGRPWLGNGGGGVGGVDGVGRRWNRRGEGRRRIAPAEMVPSGGECRYT